MLVVIILIDIILYDIEYTSIIDIYFYEYFHLALALKNILDTLSDVLVKCLHFALIKIESVLIFLTKPHFASSVVYTFLLKIL
jgi:hypothetical protein